MGSTLREIRQHFDNHNLEIGIVPQDKLPSGERRSLVAQYYAGVDWTNPQHVQSVLNVYADILSELSDPSESWNHEMRLSWLKQLTDTLNQDGYTFERNRVLRSSNLDLETVIQATDLLDKNHFREYIDRIQHSVTTDPGLAIGSTKELIESVLKTILSQMDQSFSADDDIPKLLKQTQRVLELVPEGVDDSKKGADIIKILLSNLGQVVIKVAELRNLYGTGHGKEKLRTGLNERHARLVVGAGVTLATFLLETFELRQKTITS